MKAGWQVDPDGQMAGGSGRPDGRWLLIFLSLWILSLGVNLGQVQHCLRLGPSSPVVPFEGSRRDCCAPVHGPLHPVDSVKMDKGKAES